MRFWKLLKLLLEWGEHTEFIAHWTAKAARYYVVVPMFAGFFAASWAVVKGWDSLWIAIAAIAAFAAVLLLVAVAIFLLNQIRKTTSPRTPASPPPAITVDNAVQISPFTVSPSTAANPARPIAAIETTTSTSVVETPTSSTITTITSTKIIYGEKDKPQ